MSDTSDKPSVGIPHGGDIHPKAFTDTNEEIAYWKTLALNYQDKSRRLSQQSDKQAAITNQLKGELDSLWSRVNALQAGAGPSPPGFHTAPPVVSTTHNRGVDTSTAVGAIPKLNTFNAEGETLIRTVIGTLTFANF